MGLQIDYYDLRNSSNGPTEKRPILQDIVELVAYTFAFVMLFYPTLNAFGLRFETRWIGYDLKDALLGMGWLLFWFLICYGERMWHGLKDYMGNKVNSHKE